METFASSHKKTRKMLRNRRISVTRVNTTKLRRKGANVPLSQLQPRNSSPRTGRETTVSQTGIKLPKIAKMKQRLVEPAEDLEFSEGKSAESDDDLSESQHSPASDRDSELDSPPAVNSREKLQHEIEEDEMMERWLLEKMNEKMDDEDQDGGNQDSGDQDGGDQDDCDQDDGDNIVAEQSEKGLQEKEPEEEHCIAGTLRGFSKDIGSLYSKTDGLERDVKEIKRLLQNRPHQHQCNIRTLSAQFQEKSAYYLVPKLPLLKRSHVRKMQSDLEDNDKYKMQLVNLSEFGSYLCE